MPQLLNKPTAIKTWQTKRSRPSFRGGLSLTWLVTILLFWGAIAVVLYKQQDIIDWWRLRNYSPPSAIVQLASQTTMTSYTRKVFYVNQPSLSDKASFRQQCPSGSEATIVLGCYHSKQNGIFLLDVNDPRLNGVEQVTAAHETLHAAYDRLDAGERQKVDQLLLDFYKNHLQDARVRATVEVYRKTTPKDLVNEMHSIFPTEVTDLPPDLEDYYQRYFTNRRQIVSFAKKYQSEFLSRQQAVETADAQLKALRGQVEALQAQMEDRRAEIARRDAELESQRQSGDTAAYNSGVQTFNALVNEYNAQVEQVRGLIGQYNSLVSYRNAIALEEAELAKELDSSAQTINQ